MAYFNDPSNLFVNSEVYENADYYGNNASAYSAYNQPGGSSSRDISFSTLEPTAQEFQPASSSNQSNGAVKKKPQQYPRQGRYGSGRIFKKDSRNEYGNKYFAPNEESKDVTNAENYAETKDLNYEDYASRAPQENHSQSYDNSSKQRNYKLDRNKGNYYKQPPERSHNTYDKPRRQTNYNRTNYYEKNNYSDNRNNPNYYEKHNYSDNRNNPNYYEKHNYPVNRNSRDSYRSNNFFEKSDGTRSEDSKDFKYKNYKPTVKDWRSKQNFDKDKFKAAESKKKLAASHRERLEEMINCRLLECLVCCEKIKNTDKAWSCILCYHIFHLGCVTAWAESSKIEKGWRCPACQNVYEDVPKQYKCYCGKMTEPKYDPGTIPHSCGDMCLRKGRGCDHKCSLLCHPGPCPECVVMVSKPCGCGSTNPMVKCSTNIEIVCESVCNKTLECGIHKCIITCHTGDCDLCKEVIKQECFCGKVGRKVPCRAEYSGKTGYECGEVCGKELSCGNHTCNKLCHDGPCETCPRDIEKVSTCPCGKTALTESRATCLDPIPTCDKVCGKVLKCGQPSSPHLCKERCHEGDCPPCSSTTFVRCRCGHMDKEIPCEKLTTKADDARCEKKCTKKRQCGKHKCNQRCCIEIEHVCPLPCNHLLSCGQHRCERTCHWGRCPPCIETSFEELYCECGNSIIYPPVPCGTKPPNCDKPCPRPKLCGHSVNHNCHTGPCPPCTVLCKRWCYGAHEQRSAIPCHQEKFSCGLPCGKGMPCGRHKCNKPCHGGPCPLPCKQPCTVPRMLCGHPCGKPCHDPPCPESNCKQNMQVTCSCGLQKSMRTCLEVADEFKNVQMAQMKEKMGSFSKDQAVDISDLVNNVKRPSVLKILDCTEECKVLERNRRLAIGLQIVNPDISQKLTPRYSDFMRGWAKKDPIFCQRIHDKLSELVQLAKQSKQKSRAYSFESMNRDKRHFIHEYCEHFGVESEAYDAEPNRNVVATAIKDKSWLPSMSLMEVIQRENGQRKVPGPVSMGRSTLGKSETVSLKLPCRIQKTNTPPGELVDYFDPPS